MNTRTHDLIVVGAGIAGLSLAVLARRAGLRVACVEAMMFGGLVVNVNHLRPAPPGAEGSGVDLASSLMDQAIDAGVEYLTGTVIDIDVADDCVSVTADDACLRGAALALATGARLRKLGVPGEAALEHRGVSNCADCDAPMFQGQDVAVAGSGDSALQEALVLAEFCATVHLLVRGDDLTGRADLAAAVRDAPRIRIHPRTEVLEVLGDDGVRGVRVRDADTGEPRTLDCTGFFAYVGLEPNATWLPARIARDAGGFIVTDEQGATTAPRVFALGAARAGFGGLLSDCIDDARRAAAAVARFV